MKADALIHEKNRVKIVDNRAYRINSYGEHNDYPQDVIDISNASPTLTGCISLYKKFVGGNGFLSKETGNLKVNDYETLNDLLIKIVNDMCTFGGFAVHVNYNILYQPVSYQCIPFESVRLANHDVPQSYVVHPDWGHRYTSLKVWTMNDERFIDDFNPDPEVIQAEIERDGGIENWNGQIFYYSSFGRKTYPLPIFDSILTWANTEDGLGNISNRNVNNNFLPAGAILDPKNPIKSEEQESELKEAIKQYQGSYNASSIIYLNYENASEKPEFIEFSGRNYDKDFIQTASECKTKIVELFNQPPVLRGQDVGNSFGSKLIEESYTSYNAVTNPERNIISSVLNHIFNAFNINMDFTIEPLKYIVETKLIDKVGINNYPIFSEILDNSNYDENKKIALLTSLFGLTTDEISNLIL